MSEPAAFTDKDHEITLKKLESEPLRLHHLVTRADAIIMYLVHGLLNIYWQRVKAQK